MEAAAEFEEEVQRAIEDAVMLLMEFPRAGEPAAHGQRRLRLKKLPYVIRYTFDESSQRVVLLRLFHMRQVR